MMMMARNRAHQIFLLPVRLISSKVHQDVLKSEYDAVIVGGGHNGLVAAGYLQRSGLNVCVLERRSMIGGAAVTEEIVPSFKFSRASYVLSLLRPQIFRDLELQKYGLKVHLRNPSSYTPLSEKFWSTSKAKSLVLGGDEISNSRQISQFSGKDADAYIKYEEHLKRIVEALDPLIDLPPATLLLLLNEPSILKKSLFLLKEPSILKAAKSVAKLGSELPAAWKLLTAPVRTLLDEWFESEPLRATLATDAVIGAMHDTYAPGGGYVLLHHVMGELEGKRGAWGYPEGGMGAVSQALANSAKDHGAHIFTDEVGFILSLPHAGTNTYKITQRQNINGWSCLLFFKSQF